MTSIRPVLKIVCVCRGGNTRSVAAKIIFHRYLGHDAINCGIQNNSAETLSFLFDWADKIVLMKEEFYAYVPSRYDEKTSVLDVGNDIWGNPFNPELHLKIAQLINQKSLFTFGRVLKEEKILASLEKYKEKVRGRIGDAAV